MPQCIGVKAKVCAQAGAGGLCDAAPGTGELALPCVRLQSDARGETLRIACAGTGVEETLEAERERYRDPARECDADGRCSSASVAETECSGVVCLVPYRLGADEAARGRGRPALYGCARGRPRLLAWMTGRTSEVDGLCSPWEPTQERRTGVERPWLAGGEWKPPDVCGRGDRSARVLGSVGGDWYGTPGGSWRPRLDTS